MSSLTAAVAQQQPQDVRRLLRAGVQVLAAEPRLPGVHPWSDRRAVRQTVASLDLLDGQRTTPLVLQERPTPLGLLIARSTATLLGRADAVVRPQDQPHLYAKE